MTKFYITTPIYYVNDKPHIGHANTNIIADILARWHRLKGDNVFFLTGTDEHGEKIQKAAQKAGKTEKEFVDEAIIKFKTLWKKLNISYDYFIRTTDENHEFAVKKFINKLNENNDIYKSKYKGWYCVHDESFWTDLELKNNKCPDCNREVNILEEDAYFFRLSKYQNKLLEYYDKNKDFIIPSYRAKEMKNRIKQGLRDISITRPTVKWAIKFPLDPNQYVYVWIDALINYISALDWPKKEKFNIFWSPDVQVIGKDINWFHSVIWPCLLFSGKFEIPKKLLVHGWWTINNEKMSKSKGNAINPIEIINKYSTDALRYFLIKEKRLDEDGNYSEQQMISRINGELVSDLGNLIYRVLSLAKKSNLENSIGFRGIPELDSKLNINEINKAIENLDLNLGLNIIWKFIRDTNKYVNEKKAWELKGDELSNALYNLLEACKIISILIYPFMPETGNKIAEQLNTKIDYENCKFSKNKFIGKINIGEYLFKKIEIKKEEKNE